MDVLEHAYKTMHAGLFRYNTPAEMDLSFAALRERFQNGATLADAYIALAEFGAGIRCGHTYPNFYNQPKAIVEALLKGKNRLPFEFVWLDDRMIITRSLCTNATIRAGAEVLAINGFPTLQVLKRLMKLARADGSNDFKRRALLQLQGANRYETFDIYYALCFPMNKLHTTQYSLEVRPMGESSAVTISVDPLTYQERLASLRTPEEKLKGNGAVWDLSFLNDHTALLKMPTWALYNSKWDWQQFLEQSFTQLVAGHYSKLIIDLRDNEGGLSSVGDVILEHLIRADTSAGRFNRYVRFRAVPKDLVPHLDTWDWTFLDWGTNAIHPAYQPAGGAVYYRMTRFDDNATGDVLRPRFPRFEGKVAVLMNSENSSATFQFEQMAQENQLATLIGEPSGGNRRGINGGAFFFLNLPNSQIEMDLPLIASLPTTPQPDMGLLPDKAVHLTQKNLAAGADEVLAAALRFLHESPADNPRKVMRK